MYIGLSWFGQVPVAGFCEHGNETSGSIKGGKILHLQATIRFRRIILPHEVRRTYFVANFRQQFGKLYTRIGNSLYIKLA